MIRLMKLAVLAVAVIGPCSLAAPMQVRADEASAVAAREAETNAARAKQILRSMSDYISGQKNVAAEFDLALEAITPALEKIQFDSSGHMLLSRPDKLHVSRTGGYSDVELIYDGMIATVYSKSHGNFAQLEVPGSVDKLIDELMDKYGIVMPGADLLLSRPYDELIAGVLEARYIGRGVIDGTECEHLAFRNFDTDWQLWVELGDHPVPRKYVISTKTMAGAPQYTVHIRQWTGSGVPAGDAFTFKQPEGVKRVAFDALTDLDELPPSTSPQARK